MYDPPGYVWAIVIAGVTAMTDLVAALALGASVHALARTPQSPPPATSPRISAATARAAVPGSPASRAR